jgi:hypothetical protein
MAETHVVQELQFEIAFDDEEQAWDTQQRASDFVQQRALSIVEEAFDELHAAGRVLRVESLELDLGAVDPEQLETQWAERLREQLRLALARLQDEAAAAGEAALSAEPARWQSREQAELEALMHFLRHGRHAWGVPASTDPRELAQRVWQHSADQLLGALRQAPRRAPLVARLVQQFEPAWLQVLERALWPAAHRTPWPEAGALAQQRLLRALGGAGVPERRSPQPLPRAGDAADPPPAAAGATRNDIRRLRVLLMDDAPSLSEEELHALLTLWHRLERQDPAGLRQTLTQWGARVRVRRRIAQLWPQALLQRVPALWWGDADSPLWQARLGLASTETDPPASTAAGSDRRVRWERALAQLFLGEGAAAQGAGGAEAEAATLLQQGDDAPTQPTQTTAAARHQARVAEALSRRWSAREAVALADLACQALPRAWQDEDAPRASREERVQWALQAASPAGRARLQGTEGHANGPAAARHVAQTWWLRLALQQGRSPVALWAAVQAPPAVLAARPGGLDPGLAEDPDAARCRAWRQFLPAAAGLPGVVLAALQSLAATQAAGARPADSQAADSQPADPVRADPEPADARALSAAVSRLVRAASASWSADVTAPPQDLGPVLQAELSVLLQSEQARAHWAATLDARAWHDLMTLWMPAAEAQVLSAEWARAAASDAARLHSLKLDWLARVSSQHSPMASVLTGVGADAAAPPRPTLQRSAQRGRLRRELGSTLETPAARAAFLASLDPAAWLRVLGLSLPAPEAALLDAALETLGSSWRARARAAPALGDATANLQLRLREQALLALAWTPRAAAAAPPARGTLGPLARQALAQAARWCAWFFGQHGLGAAHEPASGATRAPVGLGVEGPPAERGGPDGDGEVQSAVAALRGAGEVDTAAWLRLARRGAAPLRDAPSAQQVLAYELEVPLAAQRLAAALEPAALLQVLQWLRPAEAVALQALWPRLLGSAAADPSRWPLRARAVLRGLFEEGRVLDPESLLRRAEAAVAVQAAEASLGSSVVSTLVQSSSPSPLPSTAAEEPWMLDRPDEPLFIGNAGLVLATPYLPRLFEMLGLVRDKAFASPDGAARAVLLCEYLVSGEASAPEPLLALNKLVCGLPLAAPVPRAIELLPQEREAIEGLLQALITHWTALGKTSVAGLRQTFLQREGRLEHSDEAWQLQVQPQTFDMLLDRLPWGYTPVRFPWMPEVLHVHWR